VEKGSETKGRFVLQAAASSSETAAKELADRITAAGLKSYVEKFDGKDGVRFRVRVGPYGSREDAERGRARLRAIGVTSNLVAL
jgi:DedD protein